MSEALANTSRPSRHHPGQTFLAAGIVIVAIVIYVWLISAGTMKQWPTYTSYYDLLARGFLHGQTSLIERPPLALLKLSDPYDPNLNEGLRLHDASLFHGEYYLYWGPLPAVVLAVVRLLPLRVGTTIGDQYLAFGFAIGLLLFNALILLRIQRTLFSDRPWWTVGIALVAAAFAAPVVFLIGRASIYETAIMGGQCFLVGGFYFVLRGLETHAARGWLLGAGVGWGCAIACRFNLIAPIAGLTPVVLWRLCRLCTGWKPRRISIAIFLLPIAMSTVALMDYNAARFGSPLEFGTRYQLTWLNGFRAPPANILFSAKYFQPNLHRMWLEPMDILPRFPFLRCGRVNPSSMIHRYHLPREYFPEPVAGMATSLPFIYLAIVPPVLLGRRMVRRLGRSRGHDQTQSNLAGDGNQAGNIQTLETWLTLCFLASSILAMLSTLFVLASTMRYLADAAPSLILLASLGMWQSAQKPSREGGRFNLVLAGAGVLALAGAVIGVLLAAPTT